MSFTYNITDPITTLSNSEIQVRYTATKIISGIVKVRLVQASTLGDIDYPGTESIASDLNDLRTSQDIKISLNNNSNFINFNDEIVLKENGMLVGSFGVFYLKFIQSNDWVEGRRLYIGVEVFEA